MITQDELTRLKALCARATPGPWEVRGSTYVGNAEKMIAEIIFGRIGDPEFIAAAREALPELIAETERLNEAHEDAINAGVAMGDELNDLRQRLAELRIKVERLTAENTKFRVALRLPDAGVEEIEHRYTWEVDKEHA